MTVQLARLLDRLPEPVAVKVPQIGVLFWVIKVLSTGAGESASDYLAGRNLSLAACVGLNVLSLGLGVQLLVRRYRPWAYWGAVCAVAVFGTMAADAVHVVLGVPYPRTSLGYALLVAVVFLLWHRSQRTLDIHSITTRTREAYYWAAVLATFAFGTAAGDLSVFSSHLGYADRALLYAAMLAVPALGWWKLRLNPVIAFWSAYVLTRPLGASLADWLGKPTARSGLGIGDGVVTLVAAAMIAALVGWASLRTARDPNGARPEARPEERPEMEAAKR